MAVDKRRKCKVCNHKKVALIDKKIRNGDSINSIHKIFSVSRDTLALHRDNCMSALLQEDKAIQESLVSDSLIHQVQAQIALVQKLILACDDYLTDPDDDSKYYLGPHGHEIDVTYQEVNKKTGGLLPSRQKATLQELIQAVEGDSYVIRGITSKHADPRDLLLKAITKLEGTAKFIFEGTQKLIEWEHKKKALDKLAETGGTISIEKEIQTITEKVVVAFGKSNTVELSDLAGLPKLSDIEPL